MANGKRISWKNYKETNIKDPSTFQERPCKKKKKKKFRAESNFFQNINVSQDYQFFKTLKTYYKNSTCY